MRAIVCLFVFSSIAITAMAADPPPAFKSSKPRPTLGITFAPEPKQPRPTDAESLPGPTVSHVFEDGPAHKAGVVIGDCVIRLNGKKLAAAADVVDACEELQVGKSAKLAVKRRDDKKGGWTTLFLEITPVSPEEFAGVKEKDAEERKRLLAERQREANERAAGIHEKEKAEAADRRKEMLERPPLEITAGALGRDIINQPVLALRVKSNRPQRIEAYEVTVQCFTKFGDPVKGPRGSHVYDGIAQNEVEAEGESTVKWQLTFHNTTGLAKVRIERVKLADGTVWKPAKDDEGWIEVKTK
jgi:hypothetical protein